MKECRLCGKVIRRVAVNGRRAAYTRVHCLECVPYGKRIVLSTKHCKNCDKELVVRTNTFCGHSCAAKYSNSRRERDECGLKCFHKRRKPRYCSVCGCQLIPGKDRGKRCFSCRSVPTEWKQRTIGEIKNQKSTLPTNRYGTVRMHAREVMAKSGIDKSCRVCGYSKHVEVIHVRPIHTFSDSASTAEVNALDNLRYLCRNCHWEHDHGLLKIDR